MTARTPSGAPRPRTAPPFVGRSREIEWLERCLETALAGQPQVALLIGEAGIGKTRLVRELQSLARRRGVETCAGRGFPEFTAPFLPFIEALTPRLRELPAALERSLG
ncbi:MAG: ATP-binding protein, partial [Candidatus Binatia bacterium]